MPETTVVAEKQFGVKFKPYARHTAVSCHARINLVVLPVGFCNSRVFPDFVLVLFA